jgi:hypothetical protein
MPPNGRRHGIHLLDLFLGATFTCSGNAEPSGQSATVSSASAVDVGDADPRALPGENDRSFAPHPAAGAGDHADLALEPSRHGCQPSVEMNTFLRSV